MYFDVHTEGMRMCDNLQGMYGRESVVGLHWTGLDWTGCVQTN